MENRKPGRPKNVKSLTVEDMIDDEGKPMSMNRGTKAQNAIQFAKSLEPDAQRQNSGRGMYSGMANPESYIEFYKKAVGNPRKGRPWTYPSAQALEKEIMAYMEYCIDHRIAVTVAGLSAWLGITTATLRLWKLNMDTMPFYEVVEPAIAFIHAMTEQGAIDGTIPVVSFIFTSKNYHNLKDVMEYSVEPRKQLTTAEQDTIIDLLPES